MKLAQALAERAAVQTRLGELSGRLASSALVQEGESPVEDPAGLLAEAEQCFERLTWLVSAINATNAATQFEPGVTVTDAIARRDTLARRRTFLADDAAQAYRQLDDRLQGLNWSVDLQEP